MEGRCKNPNLFSGESYDSSSRFNCPSMNRLSSSLTSLRASVGGRTGRSRFARIRKIGVPVGKVSEIGRPTVDFVEILLQMKDKPCKSEEELTE